MNKLLSVNNRSKVKGFTLVELMVTVAIVGIITVVAFPSYQGFIQSTNRGVAQADLMSLAAAFERHKAASFTYKGAAESSNDTGKPEIFHKHSPSNESYDDRQYDLYISEASGSAYVIEARPLSGSVQADDGKLAFYSDGRRGWDVNNNGSIGTGEYCWNC